MIIRPTIMLLSIMSLSACASLPKPSGQTLGDEARSALSLSPQSLEKGECGLFVWTSNLEKRFILFAQSKSSRAVWRSPDGETQLSVYQRSGDPRQGQHPNQVFLTPEDAFIKLDLSSAEPINNGTRYQSGTLAGKDENGWTRVTPVIGLSACKPAN